MITSADVDTISIAFNESSLTLLKIVIGTILFGVALDTRIEDFRAALRKPRAMAVAIGGQFLLLPAITFLLTLVLDVRGSVALGMILVACCPPGNVSNILTHRARGDVALSVSMTAVSNVLAIFLMPLNFALWGGWHPTGEKFLRDIDVTPWDMLSEVVLVIGVPFVLGLTVARLWPRVASGAHAWVSRIAFLGLAAIIVVGVAKNWDIFTDYIGIVLLAVFLHDALALALGYGIARGSGLADYSRRAMTFEVGIRNAGLGLLLVFEFFDGLGGMALVAAWWGIWDIIAGLAVATWWARRAPTRERVDA
ncbi:bile acid:sodium symporter family protein [Aeromicrobium wangtongii]|uniref:Bile acid:sodium symporter family protein n=1 Tax=Aeromicrobium wangtongii TaxID=2969247 RepID=A0ABY5M4P3_9ACTN|nr:bile acid:sodium symporter family protein [Aeromicrobium wangtongii]MCD9199168.1 bile acid:sodium symporter family protein [Aeromicrobium wangtongii]MCL3820103.1 bile acid:sodium symporter family protein [Aeromicrobium wangtongii]UUP12802.1 bile acid:sodium symporter family protein [Aeromicrobium wangtongii]